MIEGYYEKVDVISICTMHVGIGRVSIMRGWVVCEDGGGVASM